MPVVNNPPAPQIMVHRSYADAPRFTSAYPRQFYTQYCECTYCTRMREYHNAYIPMPATLIALRMALTIQAVQRGSQIDRTLHAQFEKDPETGTITCTVCSQKSDECGCHICSGAGCSGKLYTAGDYCSSCGMHNGDCNRCNCWEGSCCGGALHNPNIPRCPVCESCRNYSNPFSSDPLATRRGACECVRCSYCGVTEGEYRENQFGENVECVVYGGDDDTEHDCEHCSICCECASQPQFFAGPEVVEPKLSTKFAANPFRSTIGVEIEVCGFRGGTSRTTKALFKYVKETDGASVKDGSLPAGGFEINTCPMNGDGFSEHMLELGRLMKSAKAFVNEKAGLHVHIGAMDMNPEQIRNLVVLYARVEDALFGIVAPSRRTNEYAVPCGEYMLWTVGLNQQGEPAERTKMKLAKNLYFLRNEPRSEGEFHEQAKRKYMEARYMALNLHSYFLRGTIEFRHHHGTTNGEKILNWALTCASVVEAAKTMKPAQVKRFVGGIEGLKSLMPLENVRVWQQFRYDFFFARRMKHYQNGARNFQPGVEADA